MYDNKRSAGRKWKNALIATALAAGIVMALPCWTVGSAEATGTEAGTTKTYEADKKSTLAITRAGTDSAKQGTIEVDLYRVADAVPMAGGYDGYTLELPEDDTFYSSIAEGLRDAQVLTTGTLSQEQRKTYNATYRELAEKAARLVLAEPTDSPENGNDVAGKAANKYVGKVEITGSGRTEFGTQLGSGMYLVIAHGKGLAPNEYIGTTADGKLITMAYNDGYVYKYEPELISLPMRGKEQYSFSTAQSEGDWNYAVEVQLKAEEDVRMVPLEITKTFTNPADSDVLVSGKDGCVYRIEATLNGRLVYSEVVAVDFEGIGQKVFKTKAIIPVGATVTVEEVYDGAGFTLRGPNPVTASPDSADAENVTKYTADFTNEYNGSDAGGGILTNSFELQGDGTYRWIDPTAGTGNNE